MSDPRVGCQCADWPKPCAYHEGWLDAVDAVSSQYEQVGWWDKAFATFVRDPNEHYKRTLEPVFRRIESADTRALIDNRTASETAEAKAWSDDAHARIRAGEVSGSHDLMREKVGENERANTQGGNMSDDLDAFIREQAERDPAFATSFLNRSGASLLLLWLEAWDNGGRYPVDQTRALVDACRNVREGKE